jgi:hypothetical protein
MIVIGSNYTLRYEFTDNIKNLGSDIESKWQSFNDIRGIKAQFFNKSIHLLKEI